MREATRSAGGAVRRVGILGGGTSSYFTALALKTRFPRLSVILVESSTLPTLGVGKATTTLMPPFLHAQLGLDLVELYREVRSTWKLDIKFDWACPAWRSPPRPDRGLRAAQSGCRSRPGGADDVPSPQEATR